MYGHPDGYVLNVVKGKKSTLHKSMCDTIMKSNKDDDRSFASNTKLCCESKKELKGKGPVNCCSHCDP